MARISRIVVPGYPHHVTQRGVRSMEVFHRGEERRAYLRFLAEEAGRFGVDILCWCLMSNHVHVIAVPHQETALARAFGEAHRRYTRLKNFAEGVRGYLFQGRFNSCILDQDPLLSAARYVELNPVRVGMVKHAWGYPWSSARYHTGVSEIDPLVKDRTLLAIQGDTILNSGVICMPHARRESIRYVVPGIVPVKTLNEAGLVFGYETFPGDHFSGLRFQGEQALSFFTRKLRARSKEQAEGGQGSLIRGRE